MELVYLWVEDYKNIHKQGFNFSPRFECKFYDEYEKYIDENGEEKEQLKENCKLEIIEKKEDEYIKDFFGKNINITAIVGKNGSGKSSILANISLLTLVDNIKGSSYKSASKYILCFKNKKNNKILVKTNIENISNKYNNDTLIYIQQSEYDKNTINKYIKLIKKFELYKNTTLHSVSFMYIPKKIKIYLNKDTKKNLDSRILNYIDSEYYRNINERKSNNEIKKDKEKELLRQTVKQLDDSKKIILNKKIDKNIEKSKIKLLIKTLKTKRVQEEKEYKYLKSILNKFIEIDEEVINYIDNIKDFVEIDFKDKNDVYFKYLSSGEQQYSILFLESYENIVSSDSINIVYGIDEAETFLHPDWQKRLIKDLLKIFKNMDKNIHFILTSHSPFLLSDIPKQNIIFLDKDEKGNCKVVDGLKEKKQTFGANIHTLLSDSFFMDNGLMGEFAKGKIDEVIKLLNKKKLEEKELKYCEQIISIIGEPIVKNQLQRMLDSKRLSKIDAINEKIKNMSYELEILKEYQSKIVKEELLDKGKKKYKERFIDDKNK